MAFSQITSAVEQFHKQRKNLRKRDTLFVICSLQTASYCKENRVWFKQNIFALLKVSSTIVNTLIDTCYIHWNVDNIYECYS